MRRQESGSSKEDKRIKAKKSALVLISVAYVCTDCKMGDGRRHSACGQRGPSDGMHDKVCYRGHMLKNSICEELKRTNDVQVDVQVIQFYLQACESK
jgi:hypothetical protein